MDKGDERRESNEWITREGKNSTQLLSDSCNFSKQSQTTTSLKKEVNNKPLIL